MDHLVQGRLSAQELWQTGQMPVLSESLDLSWYKSMLERLVTAI